MDLGEKGIIYIFASLSLSFFVLLSSDIPSRLSHLRHLYELFPRLSFTSHHNFLYELWILFLKNLWFRVVVGRTRTCGNEDMLADVVEKWLKCSVVLVELNE